MKLKKKLLKDLLTRDKFNKNESKIRSLKILIRLKCLNYLEVLENSSKLKNLASLTKVKNRCFITSRSGSINKKLSLSRIKLREFVNNGIVPGIKKYSW
jgi:ribosomal protein S14